MRAFVALEISNPGVLDSVSVFQSELSGVGADLKFVEKQNLHFTVKFLGEVSEDQAKEADDRLKSLKLQGVRVDVRGVGGFPSIARPRVLWVGLPPEAEAKVEPLARAAIQALEGVGEEEKAPFRAHVTIARVRSSRNLRELASFLGLNSDRAFGFTSIGELKLKSSVLTPHGPVYSDVGVYPLA